MAISIRVAMILQNYLPHVGGAERQLAMAAPLLQAHGVDVHVVTRRYAGLSGFEIINGVPVHRLASRGPKAAASLGFTLRALALLARMRPDVLHAYSFFSPTTTAIAAKWLFGTPVVVKVLRGGALGDLRRIRQTPLGERRIALLQRHVDAFVTISREIDAELAAIGVPEARRPFIPNGVDTGRFAPVSPAARHALRTTLDLPDAPIVVFTGRLEAEKHLDHLIACWPRIQEQHPSALLLIVGTGVEEAALKQMAGSGVRFIGRTENVVPYLQAADLFVLPSVSEGLSNALLEAMAVGLPAIATSVGGAPDVITHDEQGWLIPPGDSAALQAALLLLLEDAERRTRLGRNARDRIVADYTLQVTAGRLRALYDAVLGGVPMVLNGHARWQS